MQHVQAPLGKMFIICNMYRPPSGNVTNALSTLSDAINTLTHPHEIYLIGDFNIDYKDHMSDNYKKIKFFERSNTLKQIITVPRRYSTTRNSLLDIILTNSTNYAYCGNVSLDLSDHLPIYINRKKPKTNKTMVRFEGRSYRNYDPGILSEMLINDDWNTFYDSTDPDKCWEIMLRKMLRNSEDDWRIYKELRNATNSAVRRARSDYIKQQLDSVTDTKKFWRTINDIVPKKQNNPKLTILKDQASNSVVNPEETADFINDFFTNIGPRLASKCGNALQRRRTQPRVNLDFSLRPTSEEEVRKLISEISIYKSSAIKHLSARLVKDALNAVLPQFTHLLNMSLRQAKFPDAWKIATVIPIYKGGNSEDVTNYRPISLLPIPGKILETIIHAQFMTYLEHHKLINNLQHGFRQKSLIYMVLILTLPQ